MVERYRGRVSEGMQVRSADGEKLGKVVACQAAGFVVEKGFLFPRDLTVSYDRITAIQNGEILLSLSKTELAEPSAPREAGMAGMMQEAKSTARSAKEAIAGDGSSLRATFDEFGKAGEIVVPLTEEEVVTNKRVDKVGEVHVRKEVITEEKQFTVPVTREVLRVERVAVNHEVRAGDKPFEKESYDITLREEHVSLEKHPVVHEEVRIGKEIQRAEETASTTVRRERAEIETQGTVRNAPANEVLRPTGTGR